MTPTPQTPTPQTQTLGPHVVEVDSARFEEAVIRRSSQVPVLVDFWAPWCGPCRTLGPVLEKLAAEMAGAFLLAKVNSDENAQLAAALRVQGIPNVLLFKGGKVVDRFVGALPEARIRAFLQPHCQTAADRLISAAHQHVAAGDPETARRAYTEALQQDPKAAAAHLGLARLDLARGDFDAAAGHVEAIPAASASYGAGQGVLQAVALAREAAAVGTVADCERRLAADPQDLEARYTLGSHAAAAGRYRDALEHYLAVAQTDRHWNNEAARRAMLVVFNLVGVREPLSEEFREKLRRLYY